VDAANPLDADVNATDVARRMDFTLKIHLRLP
jgi:hypothetical protein